MNKISKKKIAILFDKSNFWISKYINKKSFKINKKNYSIKYFNEKNKIENFDIVFVLGYTKILKKNFLKKNKLNLIVHESNLPKGRGSAPMQWQILKNKNKIDICLILINQKIDSGDIILRDKMYFKGNELNEEIREKQARYTMRLIRTFLRIYPNHKLKKQTGTPSFFRKRNAVDSIVDINKSIKKQFNLFRICDNEQYPAYFIYKSNKYLLKIYKDKPYEKKR